MKISFKLDNPAYSNSFFHGDWKIKQNNFLFPEINSKKMFVGIDPGTTNIGICVLYGGEAKTFQVVLPRNPNPVNRMKEAVSILDYVVSYSNRKVLVCIEGASFGDVYRQVELAEIRAACTLWAIEKATVVEIVPPSSIRKNVFGNGSIKAKDLWKNLLPGDAADALACACYLVQVDDITRT